MRVVVGRIGKAHGIRGEVTVEVRTDEPEDRFAIGSTLLVEGSDRRLVVESARPHGGGLIIAFAGVEDRTTAEGLRGTILQVQRAEGARPDEDDEYYDSDLIGLAVCDADGVALGVVRDVIHLPGQDLLAIGADDADDSGEWLLPFVSHFVPEIDLDRRTVVVAPPEGLIEGGS